MRFAYPGMTPQIYVNPGLRGAPTDLAFNPNCLAAGLFSRTLRAIRRA